MKLSIIIVSYNTITLLEECLSSLTTDLQQTDLLSEAEIIVVDNNSTDGSPELVRKKFSNIILVRNKKNVGFARANNQGIGLSKGEYVMLLNTDTVTKPCATLNLLKLISADETIGITGPKLLNSDESIQYSAGYFPTIRNVFAWMLFIDDIPGISALSKSYHIDYESFYHEQHEVDWVSGACMIVSKKAISRAGLLDDDIFMYGEEVEWCFRLKKTGYRVVYTTESEVIHLKGGSSKSSSTAGIAEEFSFILYFFEKHYAGWRFNLVKYILVLGALLRIILFGIIGKHRERIPIYAKALYMARQ